MHLSGHVIGRDQLSAPGINQSVPCILIATMIGSVSVTRDEIVSSLLGKRRRLTLIVLAAIVEEEQREAQINEARVLAEPHLTPAWLLDFSVM